MLSSPYEQNVYDVFAIPVAEPGVAVAELSAQLTLILILLPEQLQRHAGAGELPLDVSVVRLLLNLLLPLPVGIEELVALAGRHVPDILVGNLTLLCNEEHLSHRRLGHVVGAGDFRLGQPGSTQLHDDFNLDFSGHVLASFQNEIFELFQFNLIVAEDGIID